MSGRVREGRMGKVIFCNPPVIERKEESGGETRRLLGGASDRQVIL